MKKQLFFFVASLMLVMQSITSVAQTATKPTVGAGTFASPYEVSSVSHLLWIAANTAEWNKYYKQTAHISLTSLPNAIGNATVPFSGSYDGNGKTITGYAISKALNNMGLFGKTSGATIKKLGLVNLNVSGESNVGGLVGYALGGTISECFVTGNVAGKGSLGGFIGVSEGCVITNCYSRVAVYKAYSADANDYIGCFIGYSMSSTQISKCYSTGGLTYAVLPLPTNRGFVGNPYSFQSFSSLHFDKVTSGQLTDAWATPRITADMKKKESFTNFDFQHESVNGVAEIWGLNPTANDGYPFLSWQGYTDYYQPTVTSQAVTNIIGTTASANGTVTDLGYPSPTQHGVCWNTSPAPTITNNVVEKGAASATGAFVANITGLAPSTVYYVRAFATNALGTVYGSEVSFTSFQLEGAGTSASPYLVKNLSDLVFVSANSSLWGKYFKQTDNINASSTSTMNSGMGFSPIGNNTTAFTGQYDGGGFTISNLFINRAADYVGLFGKITGVNSWVKNLGLTTANVTGTSFVGALVGSFASGDVLQCFATGSVSGVANVGGVVGIMSSSASVEYSYSKVNVSRVSGTNATIGGFVGSVTSIAIRHSYATGSVTFVGSTNPTSKGFVGSAAGTNTFDLNFFDSETSGQSTGTGAAPKTTSLMKTYSTYQGWDFEESTDDGVGDYWAMNTTTNGGYPFLGWQSGTSFQKPTISTGTASLITNSSATVSGSMSVTGGLNPTQHGHCWSATNTTPTTADSVTRKGPLSATGSFSSAIANLLPNTTYYVRAYATNAVGTSYGSVVQVKTKPFAVGAGTLASPYQIATLEDLKTLSKSSDLWVGKYFKQMDDIDAHATQTWDAGAGFTPIGNNTTKFTGNYDGNGKIIKKLFINNPNTSYIGFFGFLSGSSAMVYNLGVVDVSIKGKNYCGAIVGYNESSASIVGCYSSGTVKGVSYVGGFAGMVNSSSIKNCYSNCIVTRESGSSTYFGSFVGSTSSSGVSYCYTTGKVITTDSSLLEGTSFASYLVSTTNYYNNEISTVTGSGATGLGTALMKLATSYRDWDFIGETKNGANDYWGINPQENGGYPFLAWQGYAHVSGMKVTTDTISNVTASSATLSGSIVIGSYPATAYGFCWSASVNPTINDNKNNLGYSSGSKTFSLLLDNLSLWQTVHVRAYSIDALDTTYGQDLSFTTRRQTPEVVWNSPGDIVYGTAITSTQLNAQSTTPGTFEYSVSPGTVLNAGGQQLLSVVFTPENTAEFTSVKESVYINVNKAPLVVITPSLSITQGDAIPLIPLTYQGFVNNEDESVIDVKPVVSTTAKEGDKPGQYLITVSSASDNNYSFTYVGATLTVKAIPSVRLSSEYRRQVLSNMSNTISCESTSVADAYLWTFEAADGKKLHDSTSTVDMMPGKIALAFNSMYRVSLVVRNGVSLGVAGIIDTIYTPSFPLTWLGAHLHNWRMTSLQELVVCHKVPGATLYLYQFVDEKTGARFRHYNKGNSLRVADVVGIEPGRSYLVTVMPRFYNSLSQFSVAARIYTPTK